MGAGTAGGPVTGARRPRRAAMSPPVGVLGFLVVAVAVLSAGAGHAQRGAPGRVSATATLTVLAGAVQRVPAGARDPQPAASGTSLAVGDRVLTGPGATALITLLDGSTVTVQPGADVTVARAEVGRTGSKVTMRIHVGAVWARVVRLVDADSGMSLESSTATATTHTGLIGGQQNADGSFVCWTQSPGMTVTDAAGRRLAVQPGQRATIKPGEEPVVAPFRVNRSALRITTPSGLLPLVLMPDGARVAGFVAPGIEVNQVFGSRTGQAPDGSRGIEVPAGAPGPYLLVLEGQRDVDETLGWAALFDGRVVYQQAVPVRVKAGRRLSTTIAVTLDPSTAQDPRAARVVDAAAPPLAPFGVALPGQILLSPAEVQAVEAR